MLNILRSDLYRLLRGKCVYITFFLYLAFTGLQAAFPGDITIGLSLDFIPGLEGFADKISGITAPFIAMAFTDNIIYFMLAILFALAATDFTSGAVKNTLASGVSRTKLYFSKLILALCLCLLMYVGGILTSVVLATAMHGFGGVITQQYMLSLLRPFAAQFFLLAAAVCVGTALTFLTRKGAALIASYLLVFLGISVLMVLAMQISGSLKDLINYDFIINLKMLANNASAADNTLRALAIGAVYIATSTILGVTMFQRNEIK